MKASFFFPYFFGTLLCFTNTARAQCALQTLTPIADSVFYESFSHSFDVDGNYAVVGSPSANSYKYRTGIAYVFEKIGGNWYKIADLLPSDTSEIIKFGTIVEIEEDIIAVSANYYANIWDIQPLPVYIFRKPVSGNWTNATESERIYANGVPMNGFGESIDLYQNTLAVVRGFNIYVYEDNGTNFSQSAKLDYNSLGRKYHDYQVYISNDIIVGCASLETKDQMLIYEKPLDGWHDGAVENARLTYSEIPDFNGTYFGQNIVINENEIIADYWAYKYENGSTTNREAGAMVFNRGPSGWVNTTESARLKVSNPGLLYDSYLAIIDDYLFLKLESNLTDLYIFKKPESGWIDDYENLRFLSPDLQRGDWFGLHTNDNKLYISSLLDPYNTGYSRILEFEEPIGGWLNISTKNSEISYLRLGAENDRFGGGMDICGNTMVVGANGDDVDGDFSGVAYVFEYINESWEKVAILKQSDGRAFDNFGSEVAISENFIAVTCSYKDSIDDGERLFTDLGAVYIYKKGTAGWEDSYEVQKISPPEILNYKPRFGIALDLAENTLVISENLTRTTPSKGRIHIYELNKMNIWDHVSIVELPEDESINGFGKAISINDSVIVVGSGTSYFGIQSNSYAYVYEKDSNSWLFPRKTAVLKAENQQKGSLFGFDVHLSGNKILVGAPGFSNNSQYSGRIYLFERIGETWEEYTQLATFHSSLDEEREHLGFSVFMDEENIISGATSGEYTNVGSTPNYGNVMVFRKIKGEWQDRTESQIILSHESTFGGQVGFHDDKIIVSAYADETEVGLQSGAVHIFPSIYIAAPDVACEKNDLLIELSAFPNGGIWSGQGIINTSLGQFNANEAGPGSHSIKYTINACTYSSKLIKVLGEVNSIFDDESIHFCENDTFSLLPIIDEATYQWFFGLTETEIEILKDSTNAKLTASQEGFYSLNIETPCSSLYDTIYADSYELKIEESDPVCFGDSLILTAYPPAGRWEGTGIEDSESLFISNNAGLGSHRILYSVPGCSYADTLFIDVIKEPQTKSYLEDNIYYCDDTISLTIDNISTTDTVHWYFYKNADNSESIKLNSNTFEIVTDGFLIADIHNSCGSTRDTMKIEKIRIDAPNSYELCSQGDPESFKAIPTGGSWYINQNKINSVINPGEYDIGPYKLLYQYSIDQCIYTDTIDLTISETPQVIFENSFIEYCQSSELILKPKILSSHQSYEWFYNGSSPEFNFKEIISTDNQLVNPLSGFYMLNIRNGICDAQSDILEIQKNQLDTLFIPNVITPNNDGINDQFQIIAENIYDTELIIFDRYGKLVTELKDQLKWENISIPSGVYFYSFSYKDLCYKKINHAKGYLHILK